jgi:hypothetical protein
MAENDQESSPVSEDLERERADDQSDSGLKKSITKPDFSKPVPCAQKTLLKYRKWIIEYSISAIPYKKFRVTS